MAEIIPITPKKTCDLVAEQIIDLIVSEQYPQGSRLPNEADLGRKFQVARSTMREALKGLQAAGILTSTAGKGTFVSDQALSCIQLSRFRKMVISAEQVKDLVELRLCLEPDMARLAAQRRQEKDLEEMQRCIDAMKNAETKEELLHHGNNFHRAVCKSTNNSMMIALHYSISMQLLRLRRMDFLTIEVYRRGIGAHQKILDAIAAEDSEMAENLMKQHIMLEYERYL